jgi:hypothetical protein
MTVLSWRSGMKPRVLLFLVAGGFCGVGAFAFYERYQSEALELGGRFDMPRQSRPYAGGTLKRWQKSNLFVYVDPMLDADVRNAR